MKLIRLASLMMAFLIMACTKNSQRVAENTKITANNIVVREDFKRYFDACQVEGSVVVFDNSKNQYYASDTTQIYEPVLPASTFKVINLLIALETKIIKNENEIVQWVGSTDTVKYGYRPDIYHDMSVKEAFAVSAGWVFVELAKKIGKEKYKIYLTAAKYGNRDLSQTHADFWNFGAFGISPMNQVQFLQNLYDNRLPFSKKNMEIVKKVMINEQKTGYTLRAKTGWTRDKGINTGWLVGWEEKNSQVYFFATRLLQDRKNNQPNFGSCRKEITKKILADVQMK